MTAVLTLPRTGSVHTETEEIAGSAGQGPFRRFVAAIIAARQRQADREIAEILGRRGGVMIDDYAGVPAPRRALHRGIPAVRPAR